MTTGFDGLGATSPDESGQPPKIGFSKVTPNPDAAPIAAGQLIAPQQPKKRRRPLEKKLNIQELIKMLYRGRWIILAAFVAIFSYTVYSTYNTPYIYSSSTRMFIEKNPAAAVQLRGLGVEDDHGVSNQIQFFRSYIVAEHVARLMHDFASGKRGEIDSLFVEYFGSDAALPPDYSQLAIFRRQDNPKLPNEPGLADVGTIAARAASAVQINADGGNDYLTVSAEGYTPQDAAFICNTYIVAFAKDNLARSRSNSANLKKFLSDQLKRSYDTLYYVESRLRDYLRESSGLGLEQKAVELINQNEQMKLKLHTTQMEIAQNRKMLGDLLANKDTIEKNFYRNLTLEPYIQILQQELAQSQFDVEQMLATNTVMDPRTKKYFKDDIEAKKERIGTLNDKLKEKATDLLNSQVVFATGREAGHNEVASASSTSSAITRLRETILATQLRIEQDELVASKLDSLIASQTAEIGSMPEKVIRAAQLRRAQTSAERLYTQLEDKYMDAWLAEQSVFGSVRVEDPAGLNEAPIRPNRQASIFTGALMGLLIGVGIVVVLSFLDSTIRSPEELEAQSFSVLATIPIINQLQPLKEEVIAGSPPLPKAKFTPHRVSHLESRSSVAESYKSLRTAIQFAGLDHTLSSIAVTSSAPQEGKSTTSSNLGIVMAQMGKRTLLVDTDLRRPVLHSVYGISREPGLTNVLFGTTSLEKAVYATDVPNLFVLPCGVIPPNPAELLGSERMAELVKATQELFDFVVFDTPPVVAVTDALLVGRNVDAMVVVARSDVTKMDALLRAVEQVERTSARLLGVVLNNFNVANAYGSYYRYYQYYHYYSSEMPPVQSVGQRLKSWVPKSLLDVLSGGRAGRERKPGVPPQKAATVAKKTQASKNVKA